MLRAKWCFLALVLPLIGAGTASAEGKDEYKWGSVPAYYGDQQNYNDGQTFSPERGVTCDQSHGVCFDSDGFNKKKTERYFGKQAAILADRRYGDGDFNGNFGSGNFGNGYGNYDGVSSPRKGVVCNERAKVCTNKGGIDIGWTGEVFGKKAKNNARDWMSRQSFSPLRNVVCDNSRKVCFDRKRPSAELTQIFYGRKAVKNAWWN